ncbi:hypothetical protein [Ramlibacter sp.]|uniref:hypothetical protein n=1 Tax=Ramlibacter sp. TaxID=1917967 RepID=UPI003D0BEFF2
MSAPDADETGGQLRPFPNTQQPAGSGEGAQTALLALIRKRKLSAEPDAVAPENAPPADDEKR